MARRHYLIAYDISDDKRRNRVFDTLTDNGDHVQFSVFLCDLNPQEWAGLRAKLTELIDTRADQIIALDLGDAENPIGDTLECLGKGYNPPSRVRVV